MQQQQQQLKYLQPDLDEEDKIPVDDEESGADDNDDGRNAYTRLLSRSRRRTNIIGSINKSSSLTGNESAIDDNEDEEEEGEEVIDNGTEETQQSSPKRRRISIVRRKSTSSSKAKLRRKSITKSKNKKKLIPLDQLNLTEAEVKEDNKYYINPISQKLTKVSVEEFRGLDFVDDKVIIDNIGTLIGVSKSENPLLLEKFVINDQEMTLDQLCKPSLPIGKISDNFGRAVEGDKLRAEQSKIRSNRRKQAREQRISLQEIEEAEELRKQKEREAKAKEAEGKVEESEDKSGVPASDKDKDKEAEKEKANLDSNGNGSVAAGPTVPRQGVQLQRDSDGNFKINQESLFFDRHSNQNDEFRERVDENPFQSPITSASYGKRKYTDKWTVEETKEFYRAISTWGTDFGLIAQLFPYRTQNYQQILKIIVINQVKILRQWKNIMKN
ncbi:unnamed protein product [[Candida] boidinii]|nr:unnamed protein product [[Candida] boidinii]